MTHEEGCILVIDDDSSIIEFVQIIFGIEQEVLVAGSGAEGLHLAQRRRPDLILLDISMPDMDGLEVCRRLKADQRSENIPVIFLTSRRDPKTEALGLEAGAIDYVAKPINPAIIKARVKNHLKMKRYQDLLENLSNVDGLTGIPNRRRFDEYLAREWRRARRTQKDLSVIIMDIDQFKNFNDVHGHLQGDECLRRVAALFQQTPKRPADLVARFGGEEFVVLLPETGLDPALKMAETIRAAVEELAIPHETPEGRSAVTISCGVACITPDAESAPEDLLDAADRMLYQVKNSGRNGVAGMRVAEHVQAS